MRKRTIRGYVVLAFLLATAQVNAGSLCPLRESDPGTSIQYGKAYILFLELAGQAFERNHTLARQLHPLQNQVVAYSTMILTLKQQNMDLECALQLVEPFLSSKAEGIEASASSTRFWVIAMTVANTQLIDALKQAINNQRDLGAIVDEVADHTVRCDQLWDELTDMTKLTCYAFVDLTGDPTSKADTLNVTASERKELVAMLRQRFPGIQTTAKEGRFPPEAAAWLLQGFLNRPDFKSALKR